MLLLGELGNRLKEAREEKKISLDDLQTITKIQKRYLLGIEEGNYAIMPGKFYVRAFIKQYAEAVGLDPEQILDEFKDEIPSTYEEDEEAPELSRVKTHKELPKSASKVIELLPRLLIFAFVIAIAIIIWVFSQNGDTKNETVDKDNTTSSTQEVSQENDYSKAKNVTDEKDADDKMATEKEDKQAKEDKVADQQPKQSIATLQTQRQTTTYELSGTDKFELEITSKNRTWISIKNGKGKTFFANNLESGVSQKQDFSAEDEITIRVGYMPDTEIKVNGEVLKYEIDPMKVMTQNITIIHKKE